MCGRITQPTAFDALAERIGIKLEGADDEKLTARYNASQGRKSIHIGDPDHLPPRLH